MSRPSVISRHASQTPHGSGGRSLVAAQRARQNPRRRRLAHAARTGKHERLRNAPALDGVGERTRHSRLADDVIELLRAPLAGEDLVGHTERFGVPGSGFWVLVQVRVLRTGTWNRNLEPSTFGSLRGPEGLRHSSGTT